MPIVECNTENCTYNEDGRCQASRITLQDSGELWECCDYEEGEEGMEAK